MHSVYFLLVKGELDAVHLVDYVSKEELHSTCFVLVIADVSVENQHHEVHTEDHYRVRQMVLKEVDVNESDYENVASKIRLGAAVLLVERTDFMPAVTINEVDSLLIVFSKVVERVHSLTRGVYLQVAVIDRHSVTQVVHGFEAVNDVTVHVSGYSEKDKPNLVYERKDAYLPMDVLAPVEHEQIIKKRLVS